MKPFASILLFAAFALPLGSAQAPEPSLAEVARQKPVKKAKRIITDDDLPPRPLETSSPVSDQGAPPAGETSKSDPQKAPEEALKETRQILDRLKNDEHILKRGYELLSERYSKETDSFRRIVMEGELENKTINLELVGKQRQDAEKKLAELGAQQAKAAPTPPAAPASNQ